jgi:hypothetical protein
VDTPALGHRLWGRTHRGYPLCFRQNRKKGDFGRVGCLLAYNCTTDGTTRYLPLTRSSVLI